MDIKSLKIQAFETRKAILQMIYTARAGHTGGSLSAADLMTALFFKILQLDPRNPKWEGRDYFVLSKGHCVEAYWAVLAHRGFFPKDELATFSQFESRLIGHPNNEVPGVEVNTGALGHGLSISVGMAIGLKKRKMTNRVFTLLGDGELGEGSVWEGAMAGGHYELDNLIAIIDRNHLQISGSTEDVMTLEPLAEKWKSFGWSVKEIDGNSMEEIVNVLTSVPFERDKPSLIIAHTIKGKGVDEMENLAKWHHGVPDSELFERAMNRLETMKQGVLNG
ncbi:MAG: transketolase [Sphaerochaeta sp.]|jgi:transketolase|nr:transketolase [Spirochaetales bacterium]TAH58711.1 MAG: transketolase [Sphaerochaeta sp.]